MPASMILVSAHFNQIYKIIQVLAIDLKQRNISFRFAGLGLLIVVQRKFGSTACCYETALAFPPNPVELYPLHLYQRLGP